MSGHRNKSAVPALSDVLRLVEDDTAALPAKSGHYQFFVGCVVRGESD